MTKHRMLFTGSLAGVALLLNPAVAAASDLPGSVRDLVGVRASAGESTLESRGFTMTSGATKNGQKLGYWWNGNTKECIRTATSDGVYSQIVVAPKEDCGHRGGNGDTAAAVAVGAAALIGAIALTHKSHDHDNDRHYGDVASEGQYERGYRDGLYRESYHNYDRSQAYTQGYENGVRARGEHTSYRSNNYYGGGYSGFSYVNDLNGGDRQYVMSQLASRGFVQRDNKKTEDGRYMTYWREASRQCIIVHSNGGRVNNIESTSERTCRW